MKTRFIIYHTFILPKSSNNFFVEKSYGISVVVEKPGGIRHYLL